MKIDKLAYFYVLIVFLGWGLSVFCDKLATNRLGSRSVFPIIVSLIFGLIPLIIYYFWAKSLNYDPKGIFWLFVATLVNTTGTIGYFLLMAKTEVSRVTPITALYPIIPIILGFWILKESITFTKIIGIVLSFGAIIFLSL